VICEICNIDFIKLDKHHIQSKSKGGSNKTYNTIDICPNCHRSIHCAEIIVEGKFLTTDGYKLLWHKKDNQPITDSIPEVHILISA
jgi:hypothetical protein